MCLYASLFFCKKFFFLCSVVSSTHHVIGYPVTNNSNGICLIQNSFGLFNCFSNTKLSASSSPGLATAQNFSMSSHYVTNHGQVQSLLNSLNADDDTIKNNGGEMEESENTSRQWEAKYNSLMSFDDAANEGNTYNKATQDYWNVDSIGNNVAEGRESQTTPSVALISATLNALVSLSSL